MAIAPFAEPFADSFGERSLRALLSRWWARQLLRGLQAGPGRAGGGRAGKPQRTLPPPSHPEEEPPLRSYQSYQSYGLEDLDDLEHGHNGLAPAFSPRSEGYANEAGYVSEVGGRAYEHEGRGFGDEGESYRGGGGYGEKGGYGGGCGCEGGGSCGWC